MAGGRERHDRQPRLLQRALSAARSARSIRTGAGGAGRRSRPPDPAPAAWRPRGERGRAPEGERRARMLELVEAGSGGARQENRQPWPRPGCSRSRSARHRLVGPADTRAAAPGERLLIGPAEPMIRRLAGDPEAAAVPGTRRERTLPARPGDRQQRPRPGGDRLGLEAARLRRAAPPGPRPGRGGRRGYSSRSRPAARCDRRR